MYSPRPLGSVNLISKSPEKLEHSIVSVRRGFVYVAFMSIHPESLSRNRSYRVYRTPYYRCAEILFRLSSRLFEDK